MVGCQKVAPSEVSRRRWNFGIDLTDWLTQFCYSSQVNQTCLLLCSRPAHEQVGLVSAVSRVVKCICGVPCSKLGVW